jgi:hypothetical protein
MSGPERRGRDRMWIAKPVYESLPYFYLVAGLLLLTAAMYVTHGYWPTICFTAGCICLVAGVVIFLKRRDSRHGKRRGT